MKAISPNRVAIKLDPIADDGLIKQTEVSIEQMRRLQNRGIVHMAGSNCTFVEAGDYVSFYKAAATMLTDLDNEEYVIVDEIHILVKF